ncbi:Mur ligase family protein [Schumannella sp. 10F1B-5-1]|uniref:Mur ligase family protein n=1 Tax=Schumannella sp. 10F1B-5-1 TaxID=2590780 RepID=UPI0011317FA3|nr:Mur ligase family protein [Schumannella sp. 10F1B-5-1]TPW70868.1 hypothetical protein FJ658_12205 [Schumannella sp. 10F1B-5-1]
MGLLDVVAIAAGRITRRAVLTLRPGGATAIPGRVVERLSPGLLGRILSQPRLVVVSGSSGKGTTTKMLVAILEAHGLDLFTNKYAGNITRGMLSELLRVVDWRGRFPHEWAVMEMDEGYSALTTEKARAEVTVLINVMVDQVHRWGQPERVAAYLERTARQTTGTLVVNREDPQLRRVVSRLPERGAQLRTFGVSAEVQSSLRHGLGSAPDFAEGEARMPDPVAESVVVGYGGSTATVELSSADGAGPATLVDVELPSRGIHLAVDSAAALEGARAILGDRFDPQVAAAALADAPVVFGRGERARVRGEVAEFVLAKSPTASQVNVDALEPGTAQIAVVMGKDIPDPSLLWLIDWTPVGRAAIVGGMQAWDAALRLGYDEVEIDAIEEDVEIATDRFFALPAPAAGGGVKTVLYSAEGMRRMRRHLGLFDADTETIRTDAPASGSSVATTEDGDDA